MLFLIGLILNSWKSDIRVVRIPGVLQRFAVSYLVIALCHLWTAKHDPRTPQQSELTQINKLLMYGPEFVVNMVMLATYIYFTWFFNYDKNCPKGYQGPGGLDDGARHFNCTGGAAGYIDRVVFGSERIYQRSTSKYVYHNVMPFDPEGLLGYTTSILLTEIGLIVGRIMLREKHSCPRVWRMFLILITVAAIGYILKGTGINPVVKVYYKGINLYSTHSNFVYLKQNLWSLSYVCMTGAVSIGLLIMFYLFADVWNLWPQGRPFDAVGKNAIILYIGHEVFKGYFPFYYKVDETSHSLLLMRSCIATTLWLAIGIYLNYKKYYFTL